MSRVLVISQLPPPTHGSTIMTRTFLETLDELDCDWLLVERRFSKSITEVGKFSLRKMASALYMPARLVNAIWRFKPTTVVLFATDRSFSFLVDWSLSEILRLFTVRRINYLHTVGFTELADRNIVFSWMVDRLLGSAHKTVSLGADLTSDVIRWVEPTRIEVIPNTVADLPSDLGQRKTDQQRFVLYLSNLLPKKGAGTFVDIAIQLAPKFPDVMFVVAGATGDEGFTRSLKRQVEVAGLSSRVRFPGAIEDSHQKWQLVRDAAMLVFPSMYLETFGLVLAEAMAAGTPTAAYRTGALAPAIASASAGMVVDMGDSEGLMRVVGDLLSDTTALADMGKNARLLYENEYGPVVYREHWRALLASEGQIS